jgi:tyrosine-protein kinase Etk/Wzc
MATETPLSDLQEREGRVKAAARTEAAPMKSNEISLLDILIILAERKRMIFLITALFAIVAIIVSLLMHKSYTATATLLPPQQNSSIAAALATQQLGSLGGMATLASSGLGLKSPNEMYVAMLKSRTVEDAMVQRFGLMEEYRAHYPSDARIAFEHHVKVNGSGKDGLIHVSVEDGDPVRAATLANGYVDQFHKLSEHLAFTEASQRRLFFEEQLGKAKNDLANAEEALKKTQQTTGVIEPTGQERALIEAAVQLRAQIAAKEVQIQGMETYATGQNAQIVQAQQELESLRAQLARLGGTQESPESLLIVPKGKVPEVGLEYIRKLRDVKYNETIFEILARQFEIAKLDEAKEGSVIQVVDQAIPPDRRSSPQRTLIVLIATLSGFLLGSLLALLQAAWMNLNRDKEVSFKVSHLRRLFSLKELLSRA